MEATQSPLTYHKIRILGINVNGVPMNDATRYALQPYAEISNLAGQVVWTEYLLGHQFQELVLPPETRGVSMKLLHFTVPELEVNVIIDPFMDCIKWVQ